MKTMALEWIGSTSSISSELECSKELIENTTRESSELVDIDISCITAFIGSGDGNIGPTCFETLVVLIGAATIQHEGVKFHIANTQNGIGIGSEVLRNVIRSRASVVNATTVTG
jgi:hypothetical protein